jgi:phenylpropionate dioxygenase-like ring-hydroxylating dioxygenase large terminal subunit
MEQLPTRSKLYPFPNSWYVIGSSSELKPKQIIHKRIAGMDMVLFRTESGEACLADAYCPHLGGHLAHGGHVEGETIVCPFHYFCFDTKGTCTKTGYGTKPPPKAILKTYRIREINGFILYWHHKDDAAPEWEVPATDDSEWTEIMTADYVLRSHPQETTENSVDVGHFSVVHKYTNIIDLKDLTTQGAYLNASYGFNRAPEGFIGAGTKGIKAEIDIHVHGLGYSFVEVQLPEMKMRTRQYVFPTPIDENTINLKIGMSVNKNFTPSKIHPVLRIVPKRFLTNFLLNKAFSGYAHDVSQDFKIWENKVYMDHPALAKGDGPIGRYRQWAKQFY